MFTCIKKHYKMFYLLLTTLVMMNISLFTNSPFISNGVFNSVNMPLKCWRPWKNRRLLKSLTLKRKQLSQALLLSNQLRRATKLKEWANSLQVNTQPLSTDRSFTLKWTKQIYHKLKSSNKTSRGSKQSILNHMLRVRHTETIFRLNRKRY